MRHPFLHSSGARYLLLLAGPAICCLLVIVAAGRPTLGASAPPTTPLPRGSRIPLGDGNYFLSGVNYPWYQYYGGDIATLDSVDPDCNWSYANSFNYAAIDADFAEMQAHGVHVVRWWLFGDGRGAPRFDLNNMVTGFDADFFNHMDQALQIAAHHNIYILWSLWDFYALEQGNWLCGGSALAAQYAEAEKLPPAERDAYLAHLRAAQEAPAAMLPGGAGPASGQSCMIYAGGHRNLITDIAPGGAQDSFFNHALIPMLQRYADNPNIAGWEIMNEPEWTLTQNEYTNAQPQVTEPVDVAQMRQFFARFTLAVHTYAPGQYATVGSASLRYMGFGSNGSGGHVPFGIWSGLGFDFYGAHYYGWMESDFNNGDPLQHDYNSDPLAQQLDAPVVIGEFPANGGTAPIYLPSVRSTGGETSTLALRYICTAYAPAGEAPCTRPYTATVEFDTAAGTVAHTQTIVVPPYGGWTGQVPTGAPGFSGAARILANGPLAAAITQTGILSAGEQTAYTGQDSANLVTWLPLVTNQGAHRSRLAVQNTDAHAVTGTIKYYDDSGTAVATDTLSLAPHGSMLIDPLVDGPGHGPPAGFQGSAVVSGSQLLVATVYDLDPSQGSDAYNGVAQGYLQTTYLPAVQNSGNTTLYLQNACCQAATDTVSYYSYTGALVATQTVSLPLFGSAALAPPALPNGRGGIVVTSDQHPAAVLRSTTTGGPANTTTLYEGTQYPDQRLQFPIVHSADGAGDGPTTTFSVQNTNMTSAMTAWVTLNDRAGALVYSSTVVVPPLGQWVHDVATLPGVPPGFSGTAEILWPYVNGWGFPLVATARDVDSPASSGSQYRGISSHTQSGFVTPYTATQLLPGIYDTHWAGALAWSYYGQGTGAWNDYLDASDALEAAHGPDLDIGHTFYTPVPTPANSATATAAAETPTAAYGNGGTATAVAGQTGTPQPPCAACVMHFSDVAPSDFFYTPVQYLYCGGIVAGYADGTFRPYNNTTRAQFSKMLVLGRGWPIATPTSATFADVPIQSAFYPFVETAFAHQVISGYGCGGSGEPCDPQNRRYFRPNVYITRAQISKLIAIGMGWPFLNPPTPTFSDVPATYPFYQAIETVYAHGVISGYGCGAGCLAFRPATNATRGQLSKMLWVALTHP